MKQIQKISLVILGLLLLAVAGFAQDVIEPGEVPTTVDGFVNLYNGLYAAVVMIVGQILNILGVKKAVKSFVFVVVTAGIVIGVIFVQMGLTGGLSTAISLVSALGLFDIVKGLVKAKKSNDKIQQ